MIQCHKYIDLQNTPGRENTLCVTDLENTAEPYRTRPPTYMYAAPPHCNQVGHKLTDIEFIPLKLMNYKEESIHRARESTLYEKK